MVIVKILDIIRKLNQVDSDTSSGTYLVLVELINDVGIKETRLQLVPYSQLKTISNYKDFHELKKKVYNEWKNNLDM